jgi:hypothetical protein
MPLFKNEEGLPAQRKRFSNLIFASTSHNFTNQTHYYFLKHKQKQQRATFFCIKLAEKIKHRLHGHVRRACVWALALQYKEKDTSAILKTWNKNSLVTTYRR